MTNETGSKVRKAETEAGPASAKKVKVSAKTNNPRKTKSATKNQKASKPAGNQADDDHTTSINTFAWKASANERDALKRIEIKEEAVRQGLRHADRIRSILAPVIESSTGLDNDDNSGWTELKHWATQFDQLKKHNSEFRVFIGFAGVTGAGKTSAINSIIGFRDLLPSSNESAATAVPCLIMYNDDPNPDAAFRAEVTFKTESDVRQELDHYFDALKVLEEVNLGITSESPDSDAETQLETTSESAAKVRKAQMMEHLKDLDTVEEDNQDLLDMVSVVFGLDEADLKAETTESLLAKYPDVYNLLGRTISVVENNVDKFSDSIKPYMDSVAAVHGTSGLEFAAWPLINEVKVFVHSEVLKHGVVLVDLPGLADNVESRASIAQNYFSKLSVTAIVTPIIRARNEQTAVNLMTENQQYCMQMDGKFHKKSFCVILSKMDDINVETYLKQHSREANSEQDIQRSRTSLQTLDKEFKELERERVKNRKALKAIEQQYSKLQAEHMDAKTQANELEECKKQRGETKANEISLDRRLQSNRKQAKHLKGRILHWCIHGRNTLVKKEIQQDFCKRQKRLAMADMRHDLYDGTVDIFPISSSAYWQVERGTEYPVGFPAKQYTGIPALQHWLRHAAIPDREKHLDMALNALHGLFNTMQIWSSEFQGELSLTKEFVNDMVLHRPLWNLETALGKTFTRLAKDIKALDPMKNKDGTLTNCKERCISVVKRWSSREPNNLLCKTKMHWNTYNACVTRRGGVFRAKSQGRHRYAWIESLCNLFYEGIVRDWNLALNEKIQALRSPTNERIDEIWATLMQQLEKRIRIAAPQIKALLDVEKEKLDQVKEQLKDMIGKQFDNISIGATKAHRTIKTYVQDKWEPAFKRAKKETGKGRFERQQCHLIHHADLRGNNMFKDPVAKIADQLRDQLGSLNKEFRGITMNIRVRVRDLIMMMLKLDGKVKSENDNSVVMIWTAPSSKQEVQKCTRQVILEWAAKWYIGNDAVFSKATAIDQAIPDVYYDEIEEADDSTMEILVDEEYDKFLAREEEEDGFLP